MQTVDIGGMLKQYGFKDTAPRRLVVEALHAFDSPATAKDLHTWIEHERDRHIGIVTVYRILQLFERMGMAHRHSAEGVYSLCRIPSVHGHHVLLHCERCGKVNETHDHALCSKEDALARSAGFTPVRHVSEILGTCLSCH